MLIKAHCYWIREADIDGFRVDAIKHMSSVAISRFSSSVREYAYSLGKRRFFLFGELASPDDDIYNKYLGPNTSVQVGEETVFFGIDSLLDFQLAEGNGAMVSRPQNAPLRDVIKGFADPSSLFRRLDAQRNRALNRGELGRYLVTFVDNHDSFWQERSGRIGYHAPDEQIIAAIGYLLCSLGTPCIYYGTEQGFQGQGGDPQMREAMFEPVGEGNTSLLNTQCKIYQEIARIAAVVRSQEALRFGRMYFRQISGDGEHFGLPFGTTYTLAFSRLLYGSEILIAYNVSEQTRNDAILVDSVLHHPGGSGGKMQYLYGGTGVVPVELATNGAVFVRLKLAPHQFVILR